MSDEEILYEYEDDFGSADGRDHEEQGENLQYVTGLAVNVLFTIPKSKYLQYRKVAGKNHCNTLCTALFVT